MFNAASISKYLGFNACIPVYGIMVVEKLKNYEIIFLSKKISRISKKIK